MSYDYRLAYRLDPFPGHWRREDLEREGLAGADAMVLISILYPPEGSYSLLPLSVDGRTGEREPLSPGEMFKAWSVWGAGLADNEDLEDWQREAAKAATDIVRSVICAVPQEES